MLDDNARRLRVLTAEKRGGVDHGDMRAQHAVSLGEFQPDWASAQDDQVLDALAYVEDRLVGKIGHLVEPRNWRKHGRGPARHNEAPGANEQASRLDRVVVEKARRRLDYTDAKAGEALDGVVRRYRGDHPVNVIVDARVIDLSLDDVDAEGRRRAHGFGALAGGEQRLRRHAAKVEAVAAHAVLLDEHDWNAELSRCGGHREAP